MNKYLKKLMITFKQFLDLLEANKKREEALTQAYLAGARQAPAKVVNYGDTAPNSPERAAQIKQLMGDQGGGAVEKEQKARIKQARKTAKRIIKGK